MLLKKNVQPTEQVKGIYVTKEKRVEARNEIAKAHFHIGNQSESKITPHVYH